MPTRERRIKAAQRRRRRDAALIITAKHHDDLDRITARLDAIEADEDYPDTVISILATGFPGAARVELAT